MLYPPQKLSLHSNLVSGPLARTIENIYTDFSKLNYLNDYGSCCVAIAGMLAHALLHEGHRVSICSCYAELENSAQRFLLGYQEIVLPGQIDGHAICLVNDNVLVDFGLGNARKYFSSEVPQAIAYQLSSTPQQLASVELKPGFSISWRTDWSSPAVGKELQRMLPHLPRLLSQYYENLAHKSASKANKFKQA